jgi:hypothetical protein
MKFGLIGALLSFWRHHFFKMMRLFLLPVILVHFLTITLELELKPLIENPEAFGIAGRIGTLTVWTAFVTGIITIAIVACWYGIDFFRTTILDEPRTTWFPKFKWRKVLFCWLGGVCATLLGLLGGFSFAAIVATLFTYDFVVHPFHALNESFPEWNVSGMVGSFFAEVGLIIIAYLTFRIFASLLPTIAIGGRGYWSNFKKITKGYNVQILMLIVLYKIFDRTIEDLSYEIPITLLYVYAIAFQFVPASLIVILYKRNVLGEIHYPRNEAIITKGQ